MYFECNADGKIMICSAEPIRPNMLETEPPDDFDSDFMHEWKIVDGVFVHEPPQAQEEQRTHGERLAELEEAFEMILSGVTE